MLQLVCIPRTNLIWLKLPNNSVIFIALLFVSMSELKRSVIASKSSQQPRPPSRSHRRCRSPPQRCRRPCHRNDAPLPSSVPVERFEAKPVVVVERSQTAPPASEQAVHAAEQTAPESFELRLGTFWLVRIGIVIFLTGLVFIRQFCLSSFHRAAWCGRKVGPSLRGQGDAGWRRHLARS